MNTLILLSLITFGFIITILLLACVIPAKKFNTAKKFLIAIMPKLPITSMIEAWKNKNDNHTKPS